MEKKEALCFLECLAKGFNPFTGEELENESVFNDVRVVRKLYELRDYLNESIEDAKIKKLPFVLKTKEGIVDGPMNISAFIDKINEINLEENMKKFTRTAVMDWLYENEYLVQDDDKKRITEKGENAGIHVDHRVSMYGKEYEVILYPEELLTHILDLIESGEIA